MNNLWSEIDKHIGTLRLSVKSDGVATIAEIKAVRDGYRAIGKDPSPYRPSQEALLRRVLQGKGLFKINTVFDANNLISLRSRHSVGSYDLDQVNAKGSFHKEHLGPLRRDS